VSKQNIETFFHLPVVHLELRQKFETALMGYLGTWGKLTHEKTLKSKISWQCPCFKLTLSVGQTLSSVICAFLLSPSPSGGFFPSSGYTITSWPQQTTKR
jgi:hypothetical protein